MSLTKATFYGFMFGVKVWYWTSNKINVQL